jgi:hypothetical protein
MPRPQTPEYENRTRLCADVGVQVKSLFSLIETLIKIKFIEISETEGEFMSVAPWHARQV